MENRDIAIVLAETADMLELSGANFFRVRAYRNAARTVADHPVALAGMSVEQLREIPGIGKDLAANIVELGQSGDFDLHRELRAEVPAGLIELTRIPGLGPKRVRTLADELKIHDRATLRSAARAGVIATLAGFGEKLEKRVLEALDRIEAEPQGRLQWAEAARIVDRLMTHLRECPQVELVDVAGSFRRRRETVGDLDILAASSDPGPVMKQIREFPDVAEILGSGETKTSVVLRGGLQVDLRVLPRQSYGAAMLYFTGSKAHGIHLRKIAQARKMLLNEYGLMRGRRVVASATEEEIYRALGLRWIPPELREDRGEVEAAASGELPRLIERADLRGDLHTHSTWTDGRASIEQMGRAARDAGLDYIAVTDHSQRLRMAHGLDPSRLRRQWAEIEKVNARLSGITLLRGIEVDILPDGGLDLPDDVLAELDWVVASVHSKLDQDSAMMTARMIRAIRHPNVDVIGHPSGRLIGRREPSRFDLAEVLRVAREEGCAFEVNSQPDRLDLTDTACMTARRIGVKLVVSSDSHHPSQFAGLEYGVNQARRGWVEKKEVLNTRSLSRLRQRR